MRPNTLPMDRPRVAARKRVGCGAWQSRPGRTAQLETAPATRGTDPVAGLVNADVLGSGTSNP
ncbi:hypothetical protein GCM10023263_75330 [Phytohabitans rumicis]